MSEHAHKLCLPSAIMVPNLCCRMSLSTVAPYPGGINQFVLLDFSNSVARNGMAAGPSHSLANPTNRLLFASSATIGHDIK
jgi:hypothetical protein